MLACLEPLFTVGDGLVEAGAQARVGVDRKAERPKIFERFPLARQFKAATLCNDLVGEKAQRACSREARIELAHTAGRGIARVGVGALGIGFELAVELGELVFGEVHFAAHDEQVGDQRPHPGPPPPPRRCNNAARSEPLRGIGSKQRYRKRDGFQGAQVNRDVLALVTVAASCTQREAALLIVQRDAQPVDLRFGHELDLRACAEAACDALVPVSYVAGAEGVVQREQRRRMTYRLERAQAGAANALRRRIRCDQFGVC